MKVHCQAGVWLVSLSLSGFLAANVAAPTQPASPKAPAAAAKASPKAPEVKSAPPPAPPPPAPTPTAAVPAPTLAAPKPYNSQDYWGEPVRDASGKLLYVKESSRQTHPQTNCVMVKVSGFTSNELGRVRVAVWNGPENYAQEGKTPFRASSFWAKDAPKNAAGKNEMDFKLCGFVFNQKYAFFAHFDEKNVGYVRKLVGIPKDDYVFSNAQNAGQGPGLKRVRLSPPSYENTAYVVKEGHNLTLTF